MPPNPNRVLTAAEIQQVLRWLDRRGPKRSSATRRQLHRTIFRLACCCGLRSKEIRLLQMRDVVHLGLRPYINIRGAATKGRTGPRQIPLTWDSGTYDDIAQWARLRSELGATHADPFVCTRVGTPLGRSLVSRKWKAVMQALGPERRRQLSVHCGRHSFISHALAAGHALPNVMYAAGHRSPATTALYAHVLDEGRVRDVFGA